jgi:hypothetical protein
MKQPFVEINQLAPHKNHPTTGNPQHSFLHKDLLETPKPHTLTM